MLKSGQLLLGESNVGREGREGGGVTYHGEIRPARDVQGNVKTSREAYYLARWDLD